jgi:signal transduction histidine kinase
MQKLKLKLFWRLSALLLIILALVSAVNLYVAVNSAKNYSLQITQELDKNLAQECVNMVGGFLDSSNAEGALQDIMHSMMVINPSVEVYLLDREGKILNYAAPHKVVKLERVDVEPINTFISKYDGSLLFGDDPRNPGEKKIFSAANVVRNGQNDGYIYIILASQVYASAADMMFGNYIMRLGSTVSIITLIFAALVGLVAIYLITGQLRTIIFSIRKFQDGELDSRIVQTSGELGEIGLTFNEMADTIQNQIEELKGVERLRKELIANISHDLRTPISSIQGFSELLQTKGETLSKEDKTDYLTIINNNVQRLKKLVDDLFELSKLESKSVQPDFEPMSVSDLVYDISGKYRLIAQEKGISINTILSKNLPMARADVALIDRVLQNLIDNAVKYCKSGDVINIELNQDDEESIRITVADTGKGIAAEDVPFIFERYFKGDNNAQKAGSGLGLAIANKIVELHGGVINVKSQLNVGTTFTFSLPVLS